MQKDYWENYYKSHNVSIKPSLFAKFALENHIKPGNTLLEFGCGNGRDAIFFAMNGVDVFAIDQCEKEINLLSEINKHDNLKFKGDDFTNLSDTKLFDHVYSRFTLHSVPEDGENRAITWAHDHINPGGKFLIEARGLKNELYRLGEPVDGEPHSFVHDNHYRRFINIDKLSEKLKNTGFNIISSEEKSGFAPFNDTDYKFIRIIAIKK